MGIRTESIHAGESLPSQRSRFGGTAEERKQAADVALARMDRADFQRRLKLARMRPTSLSNRVSEMEGNEWTGDVFGPL